MGLPRTQSDWSPESHKNPATAAPFIHNSPQKNTKFMQVHADDECGSDLDVLPNELVQYILCCLPPGMYFVANKVCHKWESMVEFLLRDFPPELFGNNNMYLGFVNFAASQGHLDLLKWANHEGCPLAKVMAYTCAAKGDHLAILQWVISASPDFNVAEMRNACYYAAQGGSFKTLHWIMEHPDYQERGMNYMACRGAALGGHLDVLEWALSQGAQLGVELCCLAATGGHLDALKWLQSHGCPWDEATCHSAANEGHLHVLQWARQQGCPWNERTCVEAVKGGHLHVLQWAHQQGCPWDEETCAEAAYYGNLEVLQWARAQGCPWDEMTCKQAMANRHLHVLQWAREQGCPCDELTARQYNTLVQRRKRSREDTL